MKGWRIAAAAGMLALSVGGASLAASGTKPAGGTDPAKAARVKQAEQRAETIMTQLKMTEDQKKRARKLFASTKAQIAKIDAAGGTDQQKQQKATPIVEKLRTDMAKILTPAQQKQLEAMEAQRANRAPGAPGAPPLPPPGR